MALFGKPKGVDTGALERINQENRKRQQGVIEGLTPQLQPLSADYESKRNTLGAQLMPQAEEQLGKLRAELAGIGELEKQQGAGLARNFREQQFRQVPDLQRQIRESLGSSGLGGNARAAVGIAAPTLAAATASRDLEAGLANQQLQNQIGRETGLAETGFNTRNAALEKRFGLDTETINYLTSIGRSDLIGKANSLLGVESQFGANQLGIEQARQANEMAKSAQRGNLIASLGSLGGTAFGSQFGPLGAALGGQIGGIAGNLAGGTGGPQQFDPSLLFLMAQQKKKTNDPFAEDLNTLRSM